MKSFFACQDSSLIRSLVSRRSFKLWRRLSYQSARKYSIRLWPTRAQRNQSPSFLRNLTRGIKRLLYSRARFFYFSSLTCSSSSFLLLCLRSDIIINVDQYQLAAAYPLICTFRVWARPSFLRYFNNSFLRIRLQQFPSSKKIRVSLGHGNNILLRLRQQQFDQGGKQQFRMLQPIYQRITLDYCYLLQPQMEGQDQVLFRSASAYESHNPQETASKMQEYTESIAKLKGMEQILENEVSDRQNSLKELYLKLHSQKKHLLDLITQEYNLKQMPLDTGLALEFEELRTRIEAQESMISKLRSDIDRQSLTSASNNTELMIGKKKFEELEGDMVKGRKFSSTQYVRDYLDKTHIYKVSYEDVKYEFELKFRLKEYLEKEKKAYKEKEQELAQATQEEHRLNAQLQIELGALERKHLSLLQKG